MQKVDISFFSFFNLVRLVRTPSPYGADWQSEGCGLSVRSGVGLVGYDLLLHKNAENMLFDCIFFAYFCCYSKNMSYLCTRKLQKYAKKTG